MTTFVVVGDVHGNATALRSALALARSGPMDRLVFVGDLLTYGHDVDEVLALVGEAQVRDGAVLIIGNHDQLYFDIGDGRREGVERLPPWIQESVELTLETLGARSLRSSLSWTDELATPEGMFVAHANPFAPESTQYLVNDEDAALAAAALARRNARVGVFGHTHRARWCGCGPQHAPALDVELHASSDEPLVVNAGAIGQPRDETGAAVIARITLHREKITARFERVSYDVDHHLSSIRRTRLSPSTQERLCGFFTRATR